MKMPLFAASLVFMLLPACKKTAPLESKPEATIAAVSASAVAPAPAADVPNAAPTAPDFEGQIDVQIKSKAKAEGMTVQLLVKNGKLRFDAPSAALGAMGQQGKAYQLVHIAEGKMFSVLEQQKMALEMDIKKLGDQFKGLGPAKPQPGEAVEPPKVSRTGRMDTVAGFKCEDWEVSHSAGDKQVLCMASEGAPRLKFPSASLPSEASWIKEVFDAERFPLRSVSRRGDGEEDMRVEVTRVENKPMSASQFEIPEGYRRMNMSEMMNSISGLGAREALKRGMSQGINMQDTQEMLKKLQERRANKP